jgi:hypothetical protein
MKPGSNRISNNAGDLRQYPAPLGAMMVPSARPSLPGLPALTSKEGAIGLQITGEELKVIRGFPTATAGSMPFAQPPGVAVAAASLDSEAIRCVTVGMPSVWNR